MTKTTDRTPKILRRPKVFGVMPKTPLQLSDWLDTMAKMSNVDGAYLTRDILRMARDYIDQKEGHNA